MKRCSCTWILHTCSYFDFVAVSEGTICLICNYSIFYELLLLYLPLAILTMAARRRPLKIFLIILALFLVGTVVVLSSVSFYLSIDKKAYLTQDEVGYAEDDASWNATAHGKVERIPRIIHQTWKSEILPERWRGISEECRKMMPDYDYKLWTDADSREFIAKEYPWFLDTFDAYTYPIQRADAIRYFVLHFYGGVYLDLDVGCRRRLDTLLVHPVILPKTIPVGVSNDLMFSEKGHPFMAQTIHNLVTFDHSWILNYPTVMFSTGPMFLSAQYGIWTSSHAPTLDMPGGEVRILPREFYGKNAKVEEVPQSFFSHFYGSSWHADDAAFIGFLGTWGKLLMWIGFAFLVLGIIDTTLKKRSKNNRTEGRLGRYQILLPTLLYRNGWWNVGVFTQSLTPSSSCPTSPTMDDESMPMLPISIDVQAPSPTNSDVSDDRRSGIAGALSRYKNRLMGNFGVSNERGRSRSSRRSGYLFFLPARLIPGAVPVPDFGSRRPSPSRTSNTRSNSRGSRVCIDDELESNSQATYASASSLHPVTETSSQQVFSRPPSPGVQTQDERLMEPPPYVDEETEVGHSSRRSKTSEGWYLW